MSDPLAPAPAEPYHDEWCPLNGCRCGKCGPCAQMPECPPAEPDAGDVPCLICRRPEHEHRDRNSHGFTPAYNLADSDARDLKALCIVATVLNLRRQGGRG